MLMVKNSTQMILMKVVKNSSKYRMSMESNSLILGIFLTESCLPAMVVVIILKRKKLTKKIESRTSILSPQSKNNKRMKKLWLKTSQKWRGKTH